MYSNRRVHQGGSAETLGCPRLHRRSTQAEHRQRLQRNKSEATGKKKVRQAATHCSSPRLSCLRSRSGCRTSSGRECSCYSRSGIHEVRRSFHLFHREQTNTKMKMASKSMNINTLLAIIFSRCNHCFLRVSLNNSDSEFKNTEFTPEADALQDEIPDCATNHPPEFVTQSGEH